MPVLKFFQRSVFGVGASAGAGLSWLLLIVVFGRLIVCFDHVNRIHSTLFNHLRLAPCAFGDR
ncbi:hypothetical protein AT251_06270 [Enterovibrio nigricans]|nr:hypothetical protein AT251_06270 [Enterovibrio nigricans]